MSDNQDLDATAHADSENGGVDDASDNGSVTDENMLGVDDLEDDALQGVDSTSWNDDSWADPASPNENHGWGTPAPAAPAERRIGIFPWKGYSRQGWVPDHVRDDIEQTGWSLNGSAARDTSLDSLPSQHWAPIQLFRLSKQGRTGNAPPPTFTREQVATRLVDNVSIILDKKRTVKKIEKRINAHDRAAARLRVQKQRVESQIREYKTTREDLEDLHLAGMTFGHA
ncbi:hypothetical protein V5O48_013643 [Marasmius crinis-equi]|uniref:Uncharacterized protein n=1 Tax=Marasmius crinis-equi TaxID=585013 RepID=A0ABR3EZJ3_9AGAR